MDARLTPTQKSSASQTKARAQRAAKRPAGPAAIAQRLQRQIGNQATQHLLQAMASPRTSKQQQGLEERLQAKFGPVQRQSPEEEEVTQGQFTNSATPIQVQGDGGSAGSGAALPGGLRTGLEQLSGMDLSDVRVHRSSARPAQINALAYTQGQDIHVGPGQDKHLPHEGWHAVQQMQGRVSPTMQAKGVSINDDPGLEREADVMGTSALQLASATTAPHNTAHRSPALQLRRLLRASSLSHATLQRAVTTWGGEYDTDKYELTKTPGMDGVDIELRFKPNKHVDAELIGITQTALSLIKGSPVPFKMYGKDEEKARSSRAIPPGEAGVGTFIDQLSKFGNPLYATGKSGPGQGLADTPTGAQWGHHGWRYTDKAGKSKSKDAVLKDRPEMPSALKESSQVFETTALAVKGVQEGTFYGSVQWGWEKDAAGKVKKMPLTLVSNDVPSSVFARASELWNKAKTSEGKETIDLPIVTGKYTNTSGVWLVSSPSKPKATLTGELAENTRLEVTDKGAKQPFNKGLFKWWKTTVIDGTHIGKVGWVMQMFLSDKKTK